jgi:hypothetical protein
MADIRAGLVRGNRSESLLTLSTTLSVAQRLDPSGAWGHGALLLGPKRVYARTADGPQGPSLWSVRRKCGRGKSQRFRLVDSYTPENWE